MKHKHYDCIVAWAEGKQIEHRFLRRDQTWSEWVVTENPRWTVSEVDEYRIKKEPVLFAVKDYELCAKHFNRQTLCSLEKTDLHEIPLFTVPQRQQPLKRLRGEQLDECWETGKGKFTDVANAIMDEIERVNK